MENEFPVNDSEFTEHKIESVSGNLETGFTLGFDGSLCFGTGKNNPFAPKVGDQMRQYGRGFGFSVRGLFINGVKFFYRTDAEQKEHTEIELYGADAADWLARWDAGRGVWSIEMGGMGPGYEQAIQVTVAEILRHLIEAKYSAALWEDTEVWKRDRDAIEKAGLANKRISDMGLSGAQWGAALSLATKLYMDGPRKMMADARVKDRHIQVSKTFPALAA